MKQNIIKQFQLPSYVKGKSFADASKSIENKFKDRFDKSSLDTKKELLKRLADAQEFIKAQENPAPTVPLDSNEAFLGGLFGKGKSAEGAIDGVAGAAEGGGGMLEGMGGIGGALGAATAGLGMFNTATKGTASTNTGMEIGTGALSGAATGAQIAGPWGAAAGALAGGITSAIGAGKAKKEKEKLDYKNALSTNLQYRGTDFAMGGNMNSYADGGPGNPFDFFNSFKSDVQGLSHRQREALRKAGEAIGTTQPPAQEGVDFNQIGSDILGAYKRATDPDFVRKRDSLHMDSIQKNPGVYFDPLGTTPQRFTGDTQDPSALYTNNPKDSTVVPTTGREEEVAKHIEGERRRVRSDNQAYEPYSITTPVYDFIGGGTQVNSVLGPSDQADPMNRIGDTVNVQNELDIDNRLPVYNSLSYQNKGYGKDLTDPRSATAEDFDATDKKLMEANTTAARFADVPYSRLNAWQKAKYQLAKLTDNGEGDQSIMEGLSDKLGSALRYAPTAITAMQLNNLEEPEYERLDRMDARYQPDYVDERSLTNQVGQAAANARRGLTEASGGDLGALRANLIGSQLAEARGLSDAFLQAENINRGENRAGQEFNTNVDRTNLQQSNREMEINARNQGMYDTNKSALLSRLGDDLGNIGREERLKQMVKQSGLCYDSRGAYVCGTEDRVSEEEVAKVKSTNEKRYGGNLDHNSLFTNYLDVVMNNKKK